MSDIDARIVTAFVDEKGKIQKLDDPNFDFNDLWSPGADLDTAIKEEHYGWTLKPDLDRGIDVIPVFPEAIDICTNVKGDPTHFNTLAAVRPEVVKMDVGYWGHYNRANSDNPGEKSYPQRNFGLIQGHDVWLCNLHTDKAFVNSSDLPDKASPAGKLLAQLNHFGVGAKFLSHTVASATPFTADLDDSMVYVFIPDLHLPEKWPDAPEPGNRPMPTNAAQRLRLELRRAQHQDGYFAANPMSTGRQTEIQDYLEDEFTNSAGALGIDKDDDGPARHFSPSQVMAEKAILDRTIRSRSTWFYPPAAGNSEDSEHEDKADFAAGDPSPAIDLALLLATIRTLQAQNVKIKVIQCGDLYELWMGREFLYRNFPALDGCSLGASAWLIMMIIQSGSHGPSETEGVNDELQYRMGRLWTDEGFISSKVNKLKSWLGLSTDHQVERYVYHKWSKGELLDRHATGWNYYSRGPGMNVKKLLDDGVTAALPRLGMLLQERVTNVERFYLPQPDSTVLNALSNALDQVGRPLKDFTRKDNADVPNIFWNKLVLELFKDCGFENIHGNHDGYRSDPLFQSHVTIPSVEWISLPGIWIEHGHRWDEYNRDGVAMGAGMTNLVYYYNKKIIEMGRSKTMPKVLPQEQKSFTPGAAQWYLLVNIARNVYKNRTGSKVVKPFGIVVVGHTHSPDLVRIQFSDA